MIIVRLIGGLGNQMFQYAIGRFAAKTNNTILKLDLSEFDTYKLHQYSLNHFQIVENIATKYDLQEAIEFREKNFHLDGNFESIGDGMLLKGYWQSEKYFVNISDVIRNDFQLKSIISRKGREISVLIKNTNSVSLHIRRCDYIRGSYPDQILDVLSNHYYLKALKALDAEEKDLRFFIFSDDPQWVRKNFKIKHPVVHVDHNTAVTNYEDIYLMSLCKHNIIANSSFSWWGAWLNNNPTKKVFAPKQWFNKNAKNIDSNDIVPASWISI